MIKHTLVDSYSVVYGQFLWKWVFQTEVNIKQGHSTVLSQAEEHLYVGSQSFCLLPRRVLGIGQKSENAATVSMASKTEKLCEN